jgi:cyclophilin family peptidyl-prolyl cis-trans isomerase
MARTNDPNTAGSQIFITIGDATFLDGKYAAFGWVKSGQDVADAVKVGDKMEKVTVEVYAGTEACPIFYKNVK